MAFFNKEKADGFAPGQWKLPAPDFACEILSESTEARDRGVKREDYAAHGVAEYWIIDPQGETVEQRVLESGAVERVAPEGERWRDRKPRRRGLSRASARALR